ncbi:hypothetical protein [Paraburkholderia adhaesiva]|uniref:hypothetical protein n=1 Tax=Paraburkholderia adhaesiva TaxID=2883244 RepID=UPI001F46F808|nr:hypothetical protein [Paraburkholderia adhaesiva]
MKLQAFNSNCLSKALLVIFTAILMLLVGAFSFSGCDGLLGIFHRVPPFAGTLIVLFSAVLIAILMPAFPRNHHREQCGYS